MRRLAIIAAMGLAFTALAAPVAATAASCDWAVSKVMTPDGYDARSTYVRGTDSHGNYAGTASRPGANTNDLVIWTGGQPRVVQELKYLQWLQMAGQNSAGTVLVDGRNVAQSRWEVLLYSASGVITQLTAPAGYRVSGATALNERGDVLGYGERISDGVRVGILWSTIAVAPQIIDPAAGTPKDLDDDGTVLLRGDGSGAKAGALWRGGKVTPLEAKGKYAYLEGIRGGKVIGYEFNGVWPESQALLWDRDGNAREIDDAGTAFSINAGGLITGERSTMVGHEAVWRDTAFLGELPYPDGVTSVTETFVSGDDDSLFSHASEYGPLRWTCS